MGSKRMIVSILLILSMAACGETRDTADRVDAAVELLQDIEQNGTWETLSDGLDALDGQNYEATAYLDREDGEDITLTLQSDSDEDMLVEVVTEGLTQNYFIDGSLQHVYRIEQGRYTCVRSDDERHLIEDGARGVFDDYLLAAPGVRLSSIGDEPDEDTTADREADRYELVSKLPDALDVLEKYDNDDLRAQVEGAGTFDLAGYLVLDDETGALLRFESTYRDGPQTSLTFEVTGWDDGDDIIPPGEAEIAVPCEDSE